MRRSLAGAALALTAALCAPAAPAQRGGGEPVRLGGRTILTLRASAGGFTPRQRRVRLEQRVNAIVSHPDFDPKNVEIEVGPNERTATVWFGRQLFVTATQADAIAHDTTPERLARTWLRNFQRAYERMRERTDGGR